MKRIGSLVYGLVACAVASMMVGNLSAQTAQEGIAKVVAIKGAARYMTSANATWQPLKVGAILKPGAIIQTAANSHADLVLNNPSASVSPTPLVAEPTASRDDGYASARAEQDAIRIFENTVLAVDKLVVEQTGADTVTETQLDLKAGRIFGTVKKMSPLSKYEVKIPSGVAGIRGTVYMLTADGVLTVLAGSVILAYVAPDGSVITQVVTAGQQFDPRTGEITPIPDALRRELFRIAASLQILSARPTSFTTDERIYYVSPIRGRSASAPVGPPTD